jgi:Spy/CpxP family protein refolding chaperone
MKRTMTILAVLVLVGAVAVPVMAWYPGWGGGHHMMGHWGNGPECGRDYGNLTSEQRSKLNALDRKFYDETSDLRNQIWAESRELDSVLGSSNPDLEKAKSLQAEISELRAKVDEKTLSYELEARKIIPEDQLGSAYGGWYGHHMGPYGHMMGYGPGYCWN